jgi:Lon protease-like protein
MEEIGLFPLGIVLLPTEVVPLHVFEERYKELIGECLELDREFGLVYADEDGVRETGTRARVAQVLERFEDGRLNILVQGGERFQVERLTRGRSFLTAEVEPLVDEWDELDADADAALGLAEAFRALAATAGADLDEPDERSPRLSFEVAARVELAPEAKQQLLELRSEPARVERVRELLDSAREAILAARRLDEHAKKNGSRLP